MGESLSGVPLADCVSDRESGLILCWDRAGAPAVGRRGFRGVERVRRWCLDRVAFAAGCGCAGRAPVVCRVRMIQPGSCLGQSAAAVVVVFVTTDH